jgi:cytochrome c
MRRLLPAALLSALALSGCNGKPEASAPDAAGTAAGAGVPVSDAVATSAPVVAPTAAMGEQVFKRCAACHTISKDGRNGIGPNLHGVVGRALAADPSFNYSNALKQKGGHWDEAAMDAWITNPMKDIPGSRMSFAGIADKADRDALFLYLKSQSN